MANTAQDEIYRSFLDASQQQTTQLTEGGQSLADLILQAEQVGQDLAEQTAGATNTVRSSVASSRSAAAQSSDGSTVLSDVLGVFTSGLGLSPLAKGLFSLFGGDSSTSTPQPLVKYAMPPSVQFQAAEFDGRVMSADYDQSGIARVYGASDLTRPEPQPAPAVALNGGGGQPSQITVNVSAMDARSFLDRSSDIAAAVRDAMLNLNSINDVVSEL